MGLIFPSMSSRLSDNKSLRKSHVKTAKQVNEPSLSHKQAVKPLTLRNKIFLRSEINIFKNNQDE